MGKAWIGAAAVLAVGALALSGCHRGRDSGEIENTTETQVAPPMANVVTPPAPKPVVKPAANTVSTSETAPQPDAQRLEDAAAVGMTSRTAPGGYTSSGSSTTTTTTTTTHSTTTGPATPPASPPQI